MVNVRRALADTSVFIGIEATRFDPDRFAGYEWGVSVVTLGELRLGVLQASGPEAAARRLSTYQLAQRFEPLGIDEAVSEAWALLVSKLRAAKLRVPINDSWIAATAVAHGIAILTQDNDYAAMPDVEVITIRRLPFLTSANPPVPDRAGSAGWCQHHLPSVGSGMSRSLNGIHHTVGCYDFAALHVVNGCRKCARGVDARVGLLPIALDGA